MTNEQYLTLKEDYINHIKGYVNEEGGLFPHLTIFAEVRHPEINEEEKPAIIHIPIPDNFMINDESKDRFVTEIIPDLFSSIKEKFIPYGIAWSSEAWVRTINKIKDSDDKIPENWKEFPIKKEVIIITIESATEKECIIYDIKRKGQQINTNGELVDTVELIKNDNFSSPSGIEGRFSGLFNYFKD